MGEIQVTSYHSSAGNKSLGETCTAFVLTESLGSLTVVSIVDKRKFSSTGEISASRSQR